MKKLYLAIGIIFIIVSIGIVFWLKQKIETPLQQRDTVDIYASHGENFETQTNNGS